MIMKDGWVWYRHRWCTEKSDRRVGYLIVDGNGAKQVIVFHPKKPKTIVFRYSMADITHLEPLPQKIEFHLRLHGKLADIEK